MAANGIERIRRVMEGKRPDRIPVGFWTHLTAVDRDAAKLAAQTVAFQRRYDLDFIKSMPNGLFSVEDFGCECDYSQILSGGVAKVTKFAVQEKADWARLKKPSLRRGALARELESLKMVLSEVGDAVPVIATAFSPLTTAQKLYAGSLETAAREDGPQLKAGLDLIAESACEFVEAALALGCSGVFFANQLAQTKALSEAAYLEFGLPYDRLVFEGPGSKGWFNLTHFHGEDLNPVLFRSTPTRAVNWHWNESAPTLDAFYAENPRKVPVGGLNRGRITAGDFAAVESDIKRIAAAAKGKPLVFSTDCVIRYPVVHEVLAKVVEAVRALEP